MQPCDGAHPLRSSHREFASGVWTSGQSELAEKRAAVDTSWAPGVWSWYVVRERLQMIETLKLNLQHFDSCSTSLDPQLCSQESYQCTTNCLYLASINHWKRLAPTRRLGWTLVPWTLSSGCLGANKTTLLKHRIEHRRRWQIVVLMSYMAEFNLDASLMTNGNILKRDKSLSKRMMNVYVARCEGIFL